jgi:hypothetical protein
MLPVWGVAEYRSEANGSVEALSSAVARGMLGDGDILG